MQGNDAVLKRCDVPFESLGRERNCMSDIRNLVCMTVLTPAVLETSSGVLMARRAVAAVVALRHAPKAWNTVRRNWAASASEPAGPRTLDAVLTSSGEQISAGQFVFACGAWLGKIFPEMLGPRIFPSRQEVFFFGIPPGDEQFCARRRCPRG